MNIIMLSFLLQFRPTDVVRTTCKDGGPSNLTAGELDNTKSESSNLTSLSFGQRMSLIRKRLVIVQNLILIY